MKRRVIAHNEVGGMNLPVNLIKADWATKILTENGVEYIPAGLLVNAKTGDIRKNGVDIIPFTTGTPAHGVLLHDVFLNTRDTEYTTTVLVNGIVYLDKIQEVEPTATVSDLPIGLIDYVVKERK